MARHHAPFEKNDFTIAWAILLSLAIHLVGIKLLHPFQSNHPPVESPLDVIIEMPKPKIEPPQPLPPEPKPEPPKPHPQKLPPPVATPAPVQPVAPEHPVTPAPVESPPPQPQVIAAAPTKQAEPTFVAPAPVEPPPKSPEKPVVDLDADLGNYGGLLAREFAKYKQYPRLAQVRGWQGTVRIKLEIDANGNTISTTVSESSGFDILDKQAIEMAKKASPLPSPPEALRHRPFTVTVPVQFRLE
jgi:protein TonB